MRRLALLLLCAVSCSAQTFTGKMTGDVANLIPAPAMTGLTNCWFWQNGGTQTVPDLCGNQNFTPNSGVLVGIAQPSVSYPLAPFIQNASGYYSLPGGKGYTLNTATGTTYTLASTASQTWGDGQPHSIVMFFEINPFIYTSAGAISSSWNVIRKNNEWELQVNTTAGGTIQMLTNSTLTTTTVAAAYPVLANRFPNAVGANANTYRGWQMVTMTYDGTNACIAMFDGPLTCSASTITTQANKVQIFGPVALEAMLSYNSVLKSSNDAGSGCGAPFSGTPCVRDLLYNTALQNKFRFRAPTNPAYMKTFVVQGSNCVGDQGWGSTYQTYLSSTSTTPTYNVYNPYSTCSVITTSPSLTLNLAPLTGQSGATGITSPNSNIRVDVDGAYWGYVQARQIGPQLVTIALPGDGGSHTVTFNAVGYVGYSSSDATPFTGMYTTVVQDVRVPVGYTLTPVTAPALSNTFLFLGDSISISSQTNYYWTDGFVPLLRSNNGGHAGSVVPNSIGGGALYHYLGCNPGAGGGSSLTCTSTAWAGGSVSQTTAHTPAAFANQLKTWYGCPATLYIEAQTNDQGRSLWFASDGQIAMGYFWTQWTSICPSTVNYQQSAFYKTTSAAANGKGDFSVHYTLTGTVQSPSWQVDLAAACSAAPAPGCTNIDASGTSATGTAANAVAFPVFGDATYGNCKVYDATGPTTANNSYAGDGLHLSTCGTRQAFCAIFKNTLAWIGSCP